jgi:hypothetical protein
MVEANISVLQPRNGGRGMSKFRRYRDSIAAEGVKPLGYLEWMLGRVAGKLEVAVAVLAQNRGDNASFNHVMLALWAGNQNRDGGLLAASMAPHELSEAIKEGRLRFVVDQEPAYAS